jgi:uncharacterized protein YndB with AHSA1/START domain
MAETNHPDAAADDRTVIISRVFAAPCELVWKAWTDPKHMAEWWGPNGFTNPVCEMDVRPGGAWRIVMRSPEGVDYPLTGVYREVVAPQRIVSTVDVSEHPEEWHDLVDPSRDKTKGRPSPDLLWIVTFDDAGGETRLTVTTHFPSAALRDSFVRIGMEQGWSQSLDRLEALLAQLR